MVFEHPNRRDLLTGRAIRDRALAAQQALADAVIAEPSEPPTASPTIRLAMRAMACEWGILLNPGRASQVQHASDALHLVDRIEQQITVYKSESALSRVNDMAADRPIALDEPIFALLQRCELLTRETNGAFDVATAAQIRLWKQCRDENRLPTESELATALKNSGMNHVLLDPDSLTVCFDRPGLGLNLGAIGKGYAVDRAADWLQESGVADFLIHGGQSSLRATGQNGDQPGWSVGLGNPLFTSRRLGTLLLTNQAMATSGSNIQFYRHEGKRLGHILDPQTAWPIDQMLSATVLAPTAELADALSTAFFVMGVEKSLAYCDNNLLIGVILIPPPRRGGRLEVIIRGVPDESLFLDADQAVLLRE